MIYAQFSEGMNFKVPSNGLLSGYKFFDEAGVLLAWLTTGGDWTLGGNALYFLGGTGQLTDPGNGPAIFTTDSGIMFFKAGVDVNGVTAWYFVDDLGAAKANIEYSTLTGLGSITTDKFFARDSLNVTNLISLGLGIAFAAIDSTTDEITVSNGSPVFIMRNVGASMDMVKPLYLAADPIQPLEAATKQYVDTNAAGGVTVADTPPPTPTPGTLWFDSVSMKMCMWYDDGTSQQWITI